MSHHGVTINNPVHSIFQYDNWRYNDLNIPWRRSSKAAEFEYLLTPALRLASLYLTSPSCLQFWRHLFSGHYATTQDGKRYLARSINRPSDNQVRSILRQLQYWIKFDFRKIADPREGTALASTWSSGSSEQVSRWVLEQRPDCFSSYRQTIIYIHFSPQLFTYLTGPNGLWRENASAQEWQCFWFQFARGLLHELAHAAFALRIRPQLLHGGSLEPYITEDFTFLPYPEMGMAWEQYMFNGIFWPVSNSWDMRRGLMRVSLIKILDGYNSRYLSRQGNGASSNRTSSTNVRGNNNSRTNIYGRNQYGNNHYGNDQYGNNTYGTRIAYQGRPNTGWTMNESRWYGYPSGNPYAMDGYPRNEHGRDSYDRDSHGRERYYHEDDGNYDEYDEEAYEDGYYEGYYEGEYDGEYYNEEYDEAYDEEYDDEYYDEEYDTDGYIEEVYDEEVYDDERYEDRRTHPPAGRSTGPDTRQTNRPSGESTNPGRISMAWVQMWFQKDTWQRINREGRGWMQFSGPKGAAGVR